MTLDNLMPTHLEEPRWYACHTAPSGEAKANKRLRQQGYWTFYPHIRRRVPYGRHRLLREVESPLFSRYLFVLLRYAHESIGEINRTDYVSTVVYCGEEPLQIPGPVMDEIIQRADGDGLVASEKPPHWFKGMVGDKVRLIEDAPYFGLITSIAGLADLDKKSQITIWLKALGAEHQVSVPATVVAEVIGNGSMRPPKVGTRG